MPSNRKMIFHTPQVVLLTDFLLSHICAIIYEIIDIFPRFLFIRSFSIINHLQTAPVDTVATPLAIHNKPSKSFVPHFFTVSVFHDS